MKRVVIFSLVLCLMSFVAKLTASDIMTADIIGQLNNSHDLRLPAWGPYSKRHAGISHIPAIEEGIRFDLSVMPGINSEKLKIPSVTRQSGYHPWDFSDDLSYYSFRYELQWKDQVYADVSFIKSTDSSRLIQTEFVNNTTAVQSAVLHYMLNIILPMRSQYLQADIPDDSVWVNGVPYYQLNLKDRKSNFRDSLMYDGKLRGDSGGNDMALGRGLGNGFGKKDGDEVVYQFDLPADMTADILIRHKNKEAVTAKLSGAVDLVVTLDNCDSFKLTRVSANTLGDGCNTLAISVSGGEVIIDGFAIVPSGSDIEFDKVKWGSVPDITHGVVPGSYILKYPGCSSMYGFCVKSSDQEMHRINDSNIEKALEYFAGNSENVFNGDKSSCYEDIKIGDIYLEPNSSKTIDAFICFGDIDQVNSELNSFYAERSSFANSFAKSCNNKIDMASNLSGEPYLFSQKRMAATLLGNVCYPIYTQGQNIRHYQPGKKWLSLYTWDAGFAGIGLANVSLDRSVDLLNCYTTKPGSESAFIHHGTPLPTQIYQYMEIWNKTQSKELLSYFYPRLKQYYEFLLGRYGSSNTRNDNTLGLIRTWDYFYNSGGWDDYPPQVYVHKHKMESYAVPVVSSAHAIRAAKILRMAAIALGIDSDIAIYDGDIESLSETLQKYSWDEDSGYFGYVVVSDNKAEIMTTDQGVNYNMGLGGISPLVSGFADDGQVELMLAHMRSDDKLWSQVGLSTVDQSAPYYKDDGYWNGSVWMPHQWFLWKAMFDVGDGELALRIAKTALDVWKREVGDSYNCPELFKIKSGKWSGWHQFGALSGPVTSWFAAMYVPGTVTVGYDTWIDNIANNDNGLSVKLKFQRPDNNNVVWLCMKQYDSYKVLVNGQEYSYDQLEPGLLQLKITAMDRCEIAVGYN